jgi:hypothetical protein
LEINSNIQRERWKLTLPVLEDADSIQIGLVEVMRLIVTQQIDRGCCCMRCKRRRLI